MTNNRSSLLLSSLLIVSFCSQPVMAATEPVTPASQNRAINFLQKLLASMVKHSQETYKEALILKQLGIKKINGEKTTTEEKIKALRVLKKAGAAIAITGTFIATSAALKYRIKKVKATNPQAVLIDIADTAKKEEDAIKKYLANFKNDLAACKNIEDIKNVINHPYLMENMDEDERTFALELLIRNREWNEEFRLELLKDAIKKGLNLRLAPYLSLAAFFRDEKIVKYLIETDPESLRRDYRSKLPPLAEVAIQLDNKIKHSFEGKINIEDMNMIKILLDKGANLDSKYDDLNHWYKEKITVGEHLKRKGSPEIKKLFNLE